MFAVLLMAKMLAVEEDIKKCVKDYNRLFKKSIDILLSNMD